MWTFDDNTKFVAGPFIWWGGIMGWSVTGTPQTGAIGGRGVGVGLSVGISL